jgi:acyl-CoA hydrolase
MQWLDHASCACAVDWSGRYCGTVTVDNIRLIQPVSAGNLVRF